MIEQSLVEGLQNPDYRVCVCTIHALVDQRQSEAVPLLIPLLCNREMIIRNAAILALGTFADSQAFEPLAACLTASSLLDRTNAVQALVAMGDPRRRDAFLDALKMETKESIRVDLIRALIAFPDQEVVDMLILLLTDRYGDVRATAAQVLGKLRISRALPALEHMVLTDTNYETTIHNLWIYNSSVARRAIQMILSPEEDIDLD